MKIESATPASENGAFPYPDADSSFALPPVKSSTQVAYAKDLRLFELWGGKVPCDADTVWRYLLTEKNRVAPTTLYRRVMAIRHAHFQQGLPSPTTDPALRQALRRLQLGFVPHKDTATEISKQPTRPKLVLQAKPVTRQLLARMLDAMHRNALDRRDRAMLLLGFMAAINRAQLVAIDVSNVTFSADAMTLQLEKGKRQVTVPVTGGELCAATAVRKWIEHAALDVEGGPLFRRFDRAGDPTAHRLDSAYVSVVLKERLKAVGIEPEHYSAHSLRRGRLLEAAKGVL